MQPSVACGRSLSTPPRNSAQATASTTVTSSLSWVRAPERWLIAVCENPPAEGMALKNAPRAGTRCRWRRAPDCCRSAARNGAARARATASVSSITMIAIAKAPGSSSSMRSNVGHDRRRQPRRDRGDQGDAVLVDDADGDQQDAADHRHQRAGIRGAKRRIPISTASVAAENATRRPADVADAVEHASMLPKKLLASGSPVMPSSLGSWPAATVSPTPTLMPRGSPRRCCRSAPRARSTRATSRIDADHQRQRRQAPAGSSAPPATLGGHQGRPGEHGDRRRRADRQRARPAEQRVHRHRHHARVEPDLHRQPGDRGVCHRLRDDDGAGRQASRRCPCESQARS